MLVLACGARLNGTARAARRNVALGLAGALVLVLLWCPRAPGAETATADARPGSSQDAAPIGAPAAADAGGAAADPNPDCAAGVGAAGGCSLATQAGYTCYLGGFCGSEGWGYGDYAEDTRESSGCGVGAQNIAAWETGVSHVPPLPSFALAHCTFFYGFRACSLPTVVCLN